MVREEKKGGKEGRRRGQGGREGERNEDGRRGRIEDEARTFLYMVNNISDVLIPKKTNIEFL